MLSKILQFIFIIALFVALPARAETSFISRITGRILLQVESRGEAWYVNPKDQNKYFLGRPLDAFNLMRNLGIGITDDDLNKIPLSSDKSALAGWFAKKNSGKIFLQVQGLGQAWYVNPSDCKRYYLGSPAQAFNIMRQTGLGITNSDINKIATGYLYGQPATPANPQPSPTGSQIIYLAGDAVRNNQTEKVVALFTPNLAPIIRYTMPFLGAEGRLIWGRMLSGSSLLSANESEKVYHNYVYYQGEKIEIKYRAKKQTDGSWLIANL